MSNPNELAKLYLKTLLRGTWNMWVENCWPSCAVPRLGDMITCFGAKERELRALVDGMFPILSGLVTHQLCERLLLTALFEHDKRGS